jgi:hypothetical protein
MAHHNQPTAPADAHRITAMYERLEPLMSDLYRRWQDGKDGANVGYYGSTVQANLPPGFEFVRMHERPFGFSFSMGTEARYGVSRTATEYRWTRIK